jgi:hypothetical protein
MFALLRHVGHTSRYEIPPRPAALREHLDTDATALPDTDGRAVPGPLAAAWRWVQAFRNQTTSIRTERAAMACSRSTPSTARRPRGRTG